MATYLVTGAAGFIASKVAQALLKDGHNVVTIDNLTTGRYQNIPKGVLFIEGNCQDQSVIDQLYKYQFEAVYHIAGQSSGEISFDDPVYDLRTNAQSTLQLLKFCLDTGCKKFIYASSMSVYGDTQALPVSESVNIEPKSFYAVGKLASEHYLRIYSQFDLGVAALRLFNVYGPGQNLSNLRQGMVSIFLAQGLRDKHIHVKGDANRFRDFVYIDDVVEAFRKTEDFLKSGSYICSNICSGIKTTVGTVVEKIVELLDEPISVRFEGSTPGDQFGIYGDVTQASELIKWKSKISFDEGMEKMVEWAKNEKS